MAGNVDTDVGPEIIKSKIDKQFDLLTLGTEIAEMQVVMRRLTEIFGIKATVVTADGNHPAYREAVLGFKMTDPVIGKVSIAGAYEEQ